MRSSAIPVRHITHGRMQGAYAPAACTTAVESSNPRITPTRALPQDIFCTRTIYAAHRASAAVRLVCSGGKRAVCNCCAYCSAANRTACCCSAASSCNSAPPTAASAQASDCHGDTANAVGCGACTASACPILSWHSIRGHMLGTHAAVACTHRLILTQGYSTATRSPRRCGKITQFVPKVARAYVQLYAQLAVGGLHHKLTLFVRVLLVEYPP